MLVWLLGLVGTTLDALVGGKTDVGDGYGVRPVKGAEDAK